MLIYHELTSTWANLQFGHRTSYVTQQTSGHLLWSFLLYLTLSKDIFKTLVGTCALFDWDILNVICFKKLWLMKRDYGEV